MNRVKVFKIISMIMVFSICCAYMTVVNAKKYNMTYLYGTGDYIALVDRTNNALDEVSPSYFDVGSNGKLVVNDIDKEFVDNMHERGIKVVPFFSNHWSRERGVAAFSNTDIVTTELVNAVLEYNLDGVNVDLENMTEGSKSWYVTFVKTLREKMPEDKLVVVSVAANPNGWTTGWHGSYDYEELGKYADYLMIMAYDEHYEGGEAGPVASYEFVEKSITYATKYVVKEKLVLGLPLYGRYWKTGASSGGAAISLMQVESLVKNYQSSVTYDTQYQSMKAVVTIKESDTKPKVSGQTLTAGEYVIWYENNDTMASKLELVNEYDLKGAGTWRLGLEAASMWDVFKEKLGETIEEVLPVGIFKDVEETHWAKEAIESLGEKGIVNGRSEGIYAPEENVTRAEVATMIYRMLYDSGAMIEYSKDVASFIDTTGHWASESIEKLSEMGIINGYPDGTFKPDIVISRAETAQIMNRVVEKIG